MLLLSFFLINKPSLTLTLTWVHFTHKFLSSRVSLSTAHRHLPAAAPPGSGDTPDRPHTSTARHCRRLPRGPTHIDCAVD